MRQWWRQQQRHRTKAASSKQMNCTEIVVFCPTKAFDLNSIDGRSCVRRIQLMLATKSQCTVRPFRALCFVHESPILPSSAERKTNFVLLFRSEWASNWFARCWSWCKWPSRWNANVWPRRDFERFISRLKIQRQIMILFSFPRPFDRISSAIQIKATTHWPVLCTMMSRAHEFLINSSNRR